jgi:hypothetical protein
LRSLEAAVEAARKIYLNPRLGAEAKIDYLDVLLSQRDLLEATTVLIQTKQEQLAAIVNAYQALGGGWWELFGKTDHSGDAHAAPVAPPDDVPPATVPEVLPPPTPVPPGEAAGAVEKESAIGKQVSSPGIVSQARWKPVAWTP